MSVMAARVVDRKIDEGSGFELSETEQEGLEEALAEIERSEYVDGRQLLRELKRLGTRRSSG